MPFTVCDGAGLSLFEVAFGTLTHRRGVRTAADDRASESDQAQVDALVDRVENSLESASAHALDRICELEQIKARLDAELLGEYAWLHTVIGQQCLAFDLGRGGRSKVPLTDDQATVKEIAAATGLGLGEVGRRLQLATQPRRHQHVLQQMRDGKVGLARAMHVADAARHLDDETAASVEQKVLAPPWRPRSDADDTSERDPVVSAATFRQRLKRALAAADPVGSDERRARATHRRTAYARLTDDGTAAMTVTGQVERIVAGLERADTAARAARAAGDSRNLEQLRSDFITDAILHWWPDQHLPPQPASPSPMAAGPAADGDVTPRVTPEWAAAGESDCSACQGTSAWVGASVPASAWIVVPFEVAEGLSDAPCELPGHGWVTAAHAREIISAPGSVWRDLGVDVDTGRALDLTSRGYQPSKALADHVRARDGVCRGPGCEVLAARCDIDHEVPWPAGPTSADNTGCKHRGCHNVKTTGIWQTAPAPDHGLRWTTLSGREYLTFPKNWREAVHDEERGQASPSAGPAEPAGPDPVPPF